MGFDELIENLVYSASAMVASPGRPAPDALEWAAYRLRTRYGDGPFRLAVSMLALADDIASLRAAVTTLIAGRSVACRDP